MKENIGYQEITTRGFVIEPAYGLPCVPKSYESTID